MEQKTRFELSMRVHGTNNAVVSRENITFPTLTFIIAYPAKSQKFINHFSKLIGILRSAFNMSIHATTLLKSNQTHCRET